MDLSYVLPLKLQLSLLLKPLYPTSHNLHEVIINNIIYTALAFYNSSKKFEHFFFVFEVRLSPFGKTILSQDLGLRVFRRENFKPKKAKFFKLDIKFKLYVKMKIRQNSLNLDFELKKTSFILFL
jgi:hypothetical protein